MAKEREQANGVIRLSKQAYQEALELVVEFPTTEIVNHFLAHQAGQWSYPHNSAHYGKQCPRIDEENKAKLYFQMTQESSGYRVFFAIHYQMLRFLDLLSGARQLSDDCSKCGTNDSVCFPAELLDPNKCIEVPVPNVYTSDDIAKAVEETRRQAAAAAAATLAKAWQDVASTAIPSLQSDVSFPLSPEEQQSSVIHHITLRILPAQQNTPKTFLANAIDADGEKIAYIRVQNNQVQYFTVNDGTVATPIPAGEEWPHSAVMLKATQDYLNNQHSHTSAHQSHNELAERKGADPEPASPHEEWKRILEDAKALVKISRGWPCIKIADDPSGVKEIVIYHNPKSFDPKIRNNNIYIYARNEKRVLGAIKITDNEVQYFGQEPPPHRLGHRGEGKPHWREERGPQGAQLALDQTWPHSKLMLEAVHNRIQDPLKDPTQVRRGYQLVLPGKKFGTDGTPSLAELLTPQLEQEAMAAYAQEAGLEFLTQNKGVEPQAVAQPAAAQDSDNKAGAESQEHQPRPTSTKRFGTVLAWLAVVTCVLSAVLILAPHIPPIKPYLHPLARLEDFIFLGIRTLPGYLLVGGLILTMTIVTVLSFAFIRSFTQDYKNTQKRDPKTKGALLFLEITSIATAISILLMTIIAVGSTGLDAVAVDICYAATTITAVSLVTWMGIGFRKIYCDDDIPPPDEQVKSGNGARKDPDPTYRDNRASDRKDYNHNPGQPAETAHTPKHAPTEDDV